MYLTFQVLSLFGNDPRRMTQSLLSGLRIVIHLCMNRTSCNSQSAQCLRNGSGHLIWITVLVLCRQDRLGTVRYSQVILPKEKKEERKWTLGVNVINILTVLVKQCLILLSFQPVVFCTQHPGKTRYPFH